jgi:hypothetical protein
MPVEIRGAMTILKKKSSRNYQPNPEIKIGESVNGVRRMPYHIVL